MDFPVAGWLESLNLKTRCKKLRTNVPLFLLEVLTFLASLGKLN